MHAKYKMQMYLKIQMHTYYRSEERVRLLSLSVIWLDLVWCVIAFELSLGDVIFNTRKCNHRTHVLKCKNNKIKYSFDDCSLGACIIRLMHRDLRLSLPTYSGFSFKIALHLSFQDNDLLF